RSSSACFVEFFIAVATTSHGCCALRPVIPDASFLRHEWPKVAELGRSGNYNPTLAGSCLGYYNYVPRVSRVVGNLIIEVRWACAINCTGLRIILGPQEEKT